MSKVKSRWLWLISSVGLLGVGGPPANAQPGLASDFALPVWQGTPAGQAARGHQLDCSKTNPYYPTACELTIFTVTTGANCTSEAITTPLSGLTGANVFSPTMCIALIEGAVYLTESPAGCVFGGASVQASWRSGVNSTLFNYDGATVTTVLSGVPGFSTWVLKLTSTTIPALGNRGTLELNERFVVQFNRVLDSCPGADLPNLKANVYDAAADLAVNGQNGYVRQTIVSPV
jgi:hypothetical protein